MASTLDKDEVGAWTPHVGIISSTSSFYEGLSLKIFIQDSWMDKGGDFIQRENFQPCKREENLEEGAT
jgi:hypothetical protein